MYDPPPIGSGKLTSLQFVKELVALGGKVNLAQKQGVPGRGILGRVGATPLIAAASTSDVALVQTLLDLGADPTLTNADGTSLNGDAQAASVSLTLPGKSEQSCKA